MNKPVKVLIVEDSEDDTKLALRALRRGGFEPASRRVQTAADLETALAAERWDAVISDYKMPGFTGMDALRIFRSTGLDIPFILISGTIGEETAVSAMKAGASDYVMKKSLARLAPALERELKETQMRAAHRRDQKDLTDSQERYRLLFDASIDAVLLTAPDGRILAANPSACRMFDLTDEEIRQGGRTRLVDASDPRLAAALEERSRTGRFMGELTFVRKDGAKFPGDISTAVFRDKEGQARTSMIIRDITERKKAEQKFKDLLEAAPDAMVIVNNDAEMVLVNAQAAKLFGWSREAMLGQRIDILMPERFRRKHPENENDFFAQLRARPMGVGLDLFGLRKDGSEFPVEISLSPLETSEGTVVIAAIRDITERRQAEDALRESTNLLQLVVESVPSRIFWKDRDLRYLGCNTLFAKDAGHSRPDELTGQTDFEMGWKDQAELYRADDKAVLAAGVPKLDIEEPQTTPDGNTIWLRTSKVPLRDKDKRIIGVLGLYQDVTERKQAVESLRTSEREQRQLAEQLEIERSRLVAAQRVAKIGSWETDMATMSVIWSDETHRIYETDPAVFVPTHQGFLEFVHPADRAQVDAAFGRSLEQRSACAIEHRLLMPNGRIKFVEERWQVSFDEQEKPARVIGTCQDITERKAAEGRITHLNRVYAVLSGINTLIVRARDRDDLFKEACRIAVDKGGFHIALIAIVDRNTMTIAPVASAGVNERFLILLKDRFSLVENAPLGNSVMTRAIKEKKTVVINDLQTSPDVVFRKRYAETGILSVAVLPLIVSDEAVGVFVLYANEIEFFREEELKLLTELAGDIAFAIDHIDKQARLDYLAYYDVLTGLANRSLFLDRVAQYMRSAVSGGHKLSLFLIDLERFKNINDSLGRPAGDALLRQVAEWLTRSVGDALLLARVGADLFAAVLPEVRRDGDLARFLEKRMDAFLNHPFHLNDAVFRIAVKVGVALFPEDGTDADTLFKNAEAALKKAKASGERYLFYTQTMTEAVAGRLTLENQLRHALDNDEFVLYYQPKVNLVSGRVASAEALIRWNDPRTGLVPPGRFIPILEETGLIHDVGRWALRQAIADYLRWRIAGLPAVRIAVNVSPLQLRNRDFIDEIRQAIDVDAHAAAGLELEITESLIMADVKGTIASLGAIRALGVTIAIDDFGTGFSSLSYLAKLPVDTLKIDRSFVIDMTAGPEGLALVSTIIDLAHALKLNVVAEGVETEEQSRLLRLLSCDEMQGFLFSQPVPAEVFETRFLVPLPAA